MRRRNLISLIGIVVVAIGALALTIGLGDTPNLGLDLQGGVSVTLEPKPGTSPSSDSLDQAVQIIRQRVDALGVAEPEITRQDQNIVVDLPGVKDQDRALQLVGQTAELRFRPVLQVLSPDESASVPVVDTTPTTAGPGVATTAAPTDTTTERSSCLTSADDNRTHGEGEGIARPKRKSPRAARRNAKPKYLFLGRSGLRRCARSCLGRLPVRSHARDGPEHGILKARKSFFQLGVQRRWVLVERQQSDGLDPGVVESWRRCRLPVDFLPELLGGFVVDLFQP